MLPLLPDKFRARLRCHDHDNVKTVHHLDLPKEFTPFSVIFLFVYVVLLGYSTISCISALIAIFQDWDQKTGSSLLIVKYMPYVGSLTFAHIILTFIRKGTCSDCFFDSVFLIDFVAKICHYLNSLYVKIFKPFGMGSTDHNYLMR